MANLSKIQKGPLDLGIYLHITGILNIFSLTKGEEMGVLYIFTGKNPGGTARPTHPTDPLVVKMARPVRVSLLVRAPL